MTIPANVAITIQRSRRFWGPSGTKGSDSAIFYHGYSGYCYKILSKLVSLIVILLSACRCHKRSEVMCKHIQPVLILDPLVTAWQMKSLFNFVTTNWNFFISHAVTGGSKINTASSQCRRIAWIYNNFQLESSNQSGWAPCHVLIRYLRSPVVAVNAGPEWGIPST